MLILITVAILGLTAISLVVLRILRPGFRFFWLVAVAGALLAWISTWTWLFQLPFGWELPSWQPAELFADSLSFRADGISWPLALALTTLGLAVLLTEVARVDLSKPLPWAGTAMLTGVGVLAVSADNPLTLMLVWAALDLAELTTLLRAVRTPGASDQALLAFSTRAAALGLVLWANMLSIAGGSRLDFESMAPQSGLYMLVAAGLRLGVLPLHLPFSSDSVLRRGVGTAMRLTSAASSLVLLARIPPESVLSPLTPVLLILTAVAGIYAGWTWLRAPDDLAGRPFWVLGLGALAVASSLRGNPVGAAAWGTAMVLAGGALFLSTVQSTWMNRTLLLGAFGLSALPFSLTASGWESSVSSLFLAWPLLLLAQAFCVAGFVRHAMRPGLRENLEIQPFWSRNVYPAGIAVLLLSLLALGFLGWDGGMRLGSWIPAIIAVIMTVVLVWIAPRVRLLNPIRAQWLRRRGDAWTGALSRNLWSLYHSLAGASRAISAALEGEGAILWTLLFLALFISFMSKGTP